MPFMTSQWTRITNYGASLLATARLFTRIASTIVRRTRRSCFKSALQFCAS